VDNTKIIGVTDLKHATDIVIPEKYKDRVKEDREATQAEALEAVEHDRCDKPIAVWLSAEELGTMYAKHEARPGFYMQYLLRKLRNAGAPVEGSDAGFLKLTHGAVARVKPDPLKQERGWRFLWMPAPYVAAIAKGVK
jgi:hypothetical protein